MGSCTLFSSPLTNTNYIYLNEKINNKNICGQRNARCLFYFNFYYAICPMPLKFLHYCGKMIIR